MTPCKRVPLHLGIANHIEGNIIEEMWKENKTKKVKKNLFLVRRKNVGSKRSRK
jgi:hypothetical protein